MVLMPKDEKKKPATSSRKQSEKRPRSGAAIQGFIDPEIRAAMDEFIEEYNLAHEHKATVTSTLEASLKMYLGSKGHWPRKQKAPVA